MYDLPDKPSYFDKFDEEMIDSEDELVAGENNYIEIKSVPLEGEAKPQAPPEEEKKEELDSSSKYESSFNEGENEKKEEAKEEAKEEVKEAVVAADDDEDVLCRFCWDNTNTVENPLLSVCKCSGGVGFVHYTCLKYWLKTK